MARFKVEMWNPKARHAVVFRVDAVDAEQAAKLGKARVFRKRRSSLPGLMQDYRAEHVTKIS